ncbi:MAG TPA: 50S ribosomal protein L11 [Candidatus Gracilibacteria bacterium]
MAPKKPYAKKFKIQLLAGAATPAPPVGPVLGQYGVNIQAFCQQFNDGTAEFKAKGYKIPVICYVFEDKSFELEFKTPPAADLLRESAGIAKGSGKPHIEKVGKISQKQLEDIANIKMVDLNANDVKAGAKIIAGTARQMGLEVKA